MAKTPRTTKNRQEQIKKDSKTTDKTEKKDTGKDDKPKFDYEIKCLLLPVKKGDVVKVVSESFSGDLKVIGLDVSDFEMTLKGKVLNEVKK